MDRGKFFKRLAAIPAAVAIAATAEETAEEEKSFAGEKMSKAIPHCGTIRGGYMATSAVIRVY